MNTPRIYYDLTGKGLDPCTLSKAQYAEALKTWLCPACKTPKKGTTSIDVVIQNRRPPKTPLNIVFGVSVGIAHRDFLEELGGNAVERDLYVGRVSNEKGDQLDEFVSFRGRRLLIVRGVKDARYRTCPECGCHLYFAKDKSYLYPEPPTDVEIFESDLNQLVLSPDVYSRLNVEKWSRCLYISKLKVLDTPLDGFVELRLQRDEVSGRSC